MNYYRPKFLGDATAPCWHPNSDPEAAKENEVHLTAAAQRYSKRSAPC
jgi:hypothetical protein